MPVVDNPLMYGGSSNWEAVKTAEPPRRCTTCKTVYPSDDRYGPIYGGTLCYACGVKGGD